MPVKSDDPLRKVTLNLYEADCAYMEKRHGHGWTERVRAILHDDIAKSGPIPTPKYEPWSPPDA